MQGVNANRREALTAVGTGLGLLLFAGCERAESRKVEPARELQNYSSVPTSREGSIDDLNDWLRANPGKSVPSIEGILSYREDYCVFVLQPGQASGIDQQFLLIPDRECHS